MKTVSKEEIVAQRLINSGLSQPFETIDQLLTASLGIQSQYINHALFNIASRLQLSKDSRAKQTMDKAILAWGQRQTYHFYDTSTWQDICHFLADEKLWVPPYFEKENLNLQEASEELEKRLEKPLLRSQLAKDYGQRWDKLFLWSALFLYHSRQGQVYHKWLADDRLVTWQAAKPAPDKVLSQLLQAYFTFYGPASLADAAHFFGVRQTKLQDIDLRQLQTYQCDGKIFYASSWHEMADIPELLLLGKFDPLLVSYHHKDILIAPSQQKEVWKKAGQISALLLIKGRLRGTWTMSISGSNIRFTVVTAKRLSQRHQARIRRIFRDYARWTDKTVKSIDFSQAKTDEKG